jgi:hypothetical protein
MPIWLIQFLIALLTILIAVLQFIESGGLALPLP